MAAQAEGLGPCLLWTPGSVLLGESKAQPSGTRREHKPNECGEPRYETKKGSHLMSMVNSRRVNRKVNRQMLRTMKELLECIGRHLPPSS